MKALVVDIEVGAVGTQDARHPFFNSSEGQVRIEPRQGSAQPPHQHHLAVCGALAAGLTRGNVGTVETGVANGLQPL